MYRVEVMVGDERDQRQWSEGATFASAHVTHMCPYDISSQRRGGTRSQKGYSEWSCVNR